MKRELIAFAFTALAALTACNRDSDMHKSYRPDAAGCYADVRKVRFLGEAVDRMVAESRREAAFEARLAAIMNTRRTAVEQYREQPRYDAMLKEESAFVCAANDLLEAAFVREAERIAALPPSDRGAAFDQLTAALNRTELDPPWNTYARKRIADRVAALRGR